MSYIIPDPRWEAPQLLIPGKKPTGPVVIDWEHELVNGLKVCVNTGHGAVVNLVDKTVGSFGSDRAAEVTRYGIGTKANATNSTYGMHDLGPFSCAGWGGLTAIAVFYWENSSYSNFPGIFTCTDGNFIGNFNIHVEGSYIKAHLGNSSTQIISSNLSSYAGQLLVATARWDKSTMKLRFFSWDNQSVVSNSSPVSQTTDFIGQATLYVGGFYRFAPPSTPRTYNSSVYLALAWDRELSDAEVAEIESNPYAFLIPA